MAMRKIVALLSLSLLPVVAAETRGTFEACRPPHCDDTVPEQNVDAGDLLEDGNGEDRSDPFCLPDGDGFIGTIEGSSYIVPYAFGIESKQNAEIVDILRDIKISVENYLIQLVLPDSCGSRRQLQGNTEGAVMGFRFEKEMDLLSVACTPLVMPSADCGIFEGVIQVFGSEGDILSKVQTHLNAPKTAEVNDGILRIFSAQSSSPTLDQELVNDESTTAPSPTALLPNNQSKSSNDGGSLSTGAIIGIVVAIALVAVGVAGFLFFQHKRRNQIRDSDESVNSQVYFDKDGDLGSVPTQGSRMTVGVEDGRPVYDYNLK